MWPFSKPKSCLGVDIGAGGIKIVELRQEKGRPVLFTYGYTSDVQDVHQLLEKQPAMEEKKELKSIEDYNYKNSQDENESLADSALIKKYSETIIKICQQAKTVSKKAVVSLPVSAVFHAVVTMPLVQKNEFNSILKAEINKLLPRPADEMALDFQILPGRPDSKIQKVLVNAVPRVLVEFYSNIFQKAGLLLDSLEPESSALTRSLVGKDTSVAMLIDIGAERTNFFIVDQSVPITHHSIESGGNKISKILREILGIDENLLEQIKYDLAEYMAGGARAMDIDIIEAFMRVIDPIMKEIEYSFNLFLRQSGNEEKRPEKIVLTGGASRLPFLPQYIAEQFNVKCYIGDPWSRVVHQDGLNPVLRKIGPRMSVAIGLAMRNVV